MIQTVFLILMLLPAIVLRVARDPAAGSCNSQAGACAREIV
jgi:hypothetical protein